MRASQFFRSLPCLAAFTCVFAQPAIASFPESGLRALVPGDSQIVAGFEDPHNERVHGRLLFVTHNNSLDFDDWMGLISVDPAMGANELIEVAASSSRGELKEHLLMVEGVFDGDRVFLAAEQNGAIREHYKGEEVLAIKPFPRERTKITETRWLAIAAGRVSFFGTPILVQQALDRRTAHSGPDPRLVAHLAQLGPGVNSWSVLEMPPSVFARHFDTKQLDSAWKQLLDTTDELTIGIRYGSKVRIDFAVHTLKWLPSAGELIESARPQLLRTGLLQFSGLRLRKLDAHEDLLYGSIVVARKELDSYLSVVFGNRAQP